ncbi:MAG: hypothetical protein LBK99_10100 [Opitutaceae bacterium]|nr:hypothetical protein [Opitutaceae bacterium]
MSENVNKSPPPPMPAKPINPAITMRHLAPVALRRQGLTHPVLRVTSAPCGCI